MNFTEILATLPPADHLSGLDIVDARGSVVHHIPAAPGKMGSLRVYHAMAQLAGGGFSADVVRQGLQWFAEHVADARARPGAHPNIDLLLNHADGQADWRLVPIAR